jgi:hypothetical protein
MTIETQSSTCREFPHVDHNRWIELDPVELALLVAAIESAKEATVTPSNIA